MRQIKVIVEKHPNGYVAYPLGLQGVVVGEGDTFGPEVLSANTSRWCVTTRMKHELR